MLVPLVVTAPRTLSPEEKSVRAVVELTLPDGPTMATVRGTAVLVAAEGVA